MQANQLRSGTDAPAEGPWIKCASCRDLIYRKEFERLLRVCPLCGYHQRLLAHERIAITFDEGSFVELDPSLVSADPLKFPDYAGKLAATRERTGLTESVVTGTARLDGYDVAAGVLDFHFRAATMNAAVGEKVTRAMERGLAERWPVVLFIAAGGARVEEGLHSLMQMAKTTCAVARLRAAAVPFLVVLTDQSLAGTMASFGSLGDVTLAEPGASVGFTGRRVIEQTLRVELPDDFQTAEFCYEHGMIDQVVDRIRIRPALATLLRCLVGPRQEAEE